jgi:deoxyribodipyrimidine photo-lyase
VAYAFFLETPGSPRGVLHRLGRYTLDGRDAVSHTNLLWCLGLHDRPFPTHPVFGSARSMGLGNAEKKQDLSLYVRTFAPKG